MFVEKVCVLGAGSTKYGKLADSIADITTQASSFQPLIVLELVQKRLKHLTFQTFLGLQTNRCTSDLS